MITGVTEACLNGKIAQASYLEAKMISTGKNKIQNVKHRVITLLDREELDFLDKLGKDAMFSTGHKLSYNEILRGLIDFSISIGLSGNNIDSKDTLKEEILHQAKTAVQKQKEH